MFLQLSESPAESLEIGDDAFRGFLKSNEDTGLLADPCAMNQELERKNCLPGAWPASQQRRSTVRKSSTDNFIETNNAGRGFVLRSVVDRPARFHCVSVKAHSGFPPSRVPGVLVISPDRFLRVLLL